MRSRIGLYPSFSSPLEFFGCGSEAGTHDDDAGSPSDASAPEVPFTDVDMPDGAGSDEAAAMDAGI